MFCLKALNVLVEINIWCYRILNIIIVFLFKGFLLKKWEKIVYDQGRIFYVVFINYSNYLNLAIFIICIFLYIFYYLSVFLSFYLTIVLSFTSLSFYHSVLLCFYLSREEKKQEKQRKREKLETEEGREDKERRKQKKKKKEEKRRQEEVKNLWLPFWKIAREAFYFFYFIFNVKQFKSIYFHERRFFIKNLSSSTSHNKLWNFETLKLIFLNLWMLTLKRRTDGHWRSQKVFFCA